MTLARRELTLFAACVSLAVVTACGHKSGPAPAPSASASAAAPPASGSVAVPVPDAPSKPIPFEGPFARVKEVTACKQQTGGVAEYLQRGDFSIAGSQRNFAIVWLIQIQGKTKQQIGFGGFNPSAQKIARPRSIGESQDVMPRVYLSGDGWNAVWFDELGLAYAKPTWDPRPPQVEHLKAVSADLANDVGHARSNDGVVAATPYGDAKDQLGLFLFASAGAKDASEVSAIGATHYAKKPTGAAIAADAEGFLVAWSEADGALLASRVDAQGKEPGKAVAIAPANAKRARVAIAPTKTGAVVLYADEDAILSQPIDKQAKPTAAPTLLGHGKGGSIMSFGEGALALWVGTDGRSADQVLAIRLGANGAPAKSGLTISDGTAVVGTPAAAQGEGPNASHLAFVYAEPMGASVSSLRASIRVIEAACVPE